MQLIESASGSKIHPVTGLKVRCMTYKFASGQSYTKFADGTEVFTNANGKVMDRKKMHRKVSYMLCLAGGDIN